MSRHHHHQKKSRYRYDVIDDRPMLSSAEADKLEAAANDDFDDDSNKYDEEINQFLDEVSEELFKDKEPVKSSARKCEPPEDSPKNHDDKPNYWYQDMCKIKIRETKEKMEDLSKLACYTCPLIGDHIKRMEQDHGTTFCKMDYNVRHPPFNRPWTNTWKFECSDKGKKTGEPSHTHTAYGAESVMLTPVGSNISEIDYPEYIKDAVKLFEDFILEVNRNGSMTDTKEISNTAYSTSMWKGIKVHLRSNCNNDVMMIVRAKQIPSHLLYKLRRFFQRAPEADTNVVSVFVVEQAGFPKKAGEHVTGLYSLKDVIGPISIEYRPKINADFNAVETLQLCKIIKEFAGLTQETTLLDIGCNFGVLSLLLSFDCEAVFGINTMHSVNGDIRQAEELKKLNKIQNASFIPCNEDELLTKCSPFIRQCITVAVLHLSPHYGKNKNAMIALRNLPSIWRVIVYGSFQKIFHRSINTLITEDHALGLGERYLPMQGCILDKSSSNETAFDIVILFERPSLITPKVELFESGPTLNIKPDSDVYEYGSVDVKEMKPKREDRYQESRNSREEFDEERPSRSTEARRSDYSRDEERHRREKDRSSHSSRSREHRTEHSRRSRDDRRSPEERPHSTSRHRSSRKDRQMLRDERFDSPPPRNHEKQPHQSRDRHQRVSPTSPISKDDSPPSTSRSRSSSTSARDKSPVEKIPQEPRGKQPPAPHSLLSVKREFQYTCASPPRERNPSPPLFPPPEESDFVEEDFVTYPTSRIVTAAPTQPTESRESLVSNAADDGVFKVPIKPEPTNPVIANLKHETEDMDISPNPPDFQSMETPIHNPRAFTHPPPIPPDTNVTIGEFEFPLQAHLSYLPRDQNAEANDLLDVSQIKKEKDAGDEIPTTGQTAGDPDVKKEKDAGDETLTNGEAVGNAPEIKKEKDAGDETLTTDEAIGNASEIKKEKDAVDERVIEPANGVSEASKGNDEGDKILATGETTDDSPEIKKEKDSSDGPTGVTMDDGNAMVKIKTEVVDPSYYASSSEANHEVMPPPVIIKSEPLESPEIPAVKVKSEPVDMDISPNPLNIESMETPMHNPRLLDCSSPASPPVKINELEFSVQPNLSYLSIKREPEPSVPSVNVKTESSVSSVNVKTEPDDEIAIIGEKRSKPKRSQPKIRVKTVDEIIKVKTELIEKEDLETLIEKRQRLLRKLGREEEERLETDLPRAYKRSSRSPSRKYKRSPGSSPRRYSRSPSPYHKRKRSRNSPSERRRRRSPSSPIRFKKEPLSPTTDRRRERKRRSPSLDMRVVYGTTNTWDRRSRRSRSRSPRRR